MKHLPYIAIVILLIALVVMWVETPAGYLQREYEREKLYKDSIEGILTYYERELVRKDSAAFKLFVRTQEAANRWEGESNHWKEKYKDEKKRKTGIVTDRAYDSLLNDLLPR